MGSGVVHLDPFLSDDEADRIVEICETFGPYRMYSEEPVEPSDVGGLPRDLDEVHELLRSDKPKAGDEPADILRARTDYFRAEYAFAGRPLTAGVERFLEPTSFVGAARAMNRRPVVATTSITANIMVPGQEVRLHTDVPEFRGMNRKTHPPWLLTAMAYSGLFDAWRITMATGISWYQACRGGAFRCLPDGPAAPPTVVPPTFNSCLVLDADRVFHGVDRLGSPTEPVAAIRPGMQLTYDGQARWLVRAADSDGPPIARYGWNDLRLSVSWKAHCFRDDRERDVARDHSDDVHLDHVLATFIDELRRRGRLAGDLPDPRGLASLIIDEYIRYQPDGHRRGRRAAPAAVAVPAPE